jgi:ADP-ribose pyrophosphatase YjhB (NUDIX family)
MAEQHPEIQLISSLVVRDPNGRVLFVRYHPDDERWWLPGEDLEPYEHPDERARKALEGIGGPEPASLSMVFVESFRGRRGWHVVFHYDVEADGQPHGDIPAEWFPQDELPKTMHGRWELEAVRRVLAST